MPEDYLLGRRRRLSRPEGTLLDDKTKSKMMSVLAEKLDPDRAGVLVPGVDRREWSAVLREASQMFAQAADKTAGETSAGQGGAEGKALPRSGSRPVLFTDGASRGNPGPAAAGAVVYLGQDQVGSLSKALGIKTNNQAEYEALLEGLKLVRELGFGEVSIRSDSQLMVRQIQGRYRVKDPKLKPLFQRAKAMLKEFSGYDIVHIERGLNHVADGLANKALDAGRG